jgi:UDP-glucose 4-epimerase
MPLRANFLPYEALPGKYQDVRHRIPDTTKARELLGLEAKVSLAEGIARSIDWHREQRSARETALGA